MKTDIEIAQEAKMVHIKDVASKLDIKDDELELYGKYKAKLSDELSERVRDRADQTVISLPTHCADSSRPLPKMPP